MTIQIPCPVCREPVSWKAWSEKYGADADGHRYVMVDNAEPIEDCPNRCNWTGGQYKEAQASAIKEYHNR